VAGGIQVGTRWRPHTRVPWLSVSVNCFVRYSVYDDMNEKLMITKDRAASVGICEYT
jgi:hypothetical protein